MGIVEGEACKKCGDKRKYIINNRKNNKIYFYKSCVRCTNDRNKKNYKKHAEKYYKVSRQYILNNIEKKMIYDKTYTLRNKEKIKEYKRKFWIKNKDKEYARHRKYLLSKKGKKIISDRGKLITKEMRDSYIRKLLNVTKKDNIPQEIIELKRVELKLKRAIKLRRLNEQH